MIRKPALQGYVNEAGIADGLASSYLDITGVQSGWVPTWNGSHWVAEAAPNPFNQSLNTTDSPTFEDLLLNATPSNPYTSYIASAKGSSALNFASGSIIQWGPGSDAHALAPDVVLSRIGSHAMALQNAIGGYSALDLATLTAHTSLVSPSLTLNGTTLNSAASNSVPGWLSAADHATFAAKQAAITTGTTAQYFRGDLSLATLNQAAVAGLTTADSPTFSGVALNGAASLTHAWSSGASALTIQDSGFDPLFRFLTYGANNNVLEVGGLSLFQAYNTTTYFSNFTDACYFRSKAIELSNYNAYTDSSGVRRPVTISPSYSQSGTAGSTDLTINRTQTSLGSGSQLFLDCQVGGVSKFNVTNSGDIVNSGNMVIGGTIYATGAVNASNIYGNTLNATGTIQGAALAISGALADGTYTPITSITITKGVISAIS